MRSITKIWVLLFIITGLSAGASAFARKHQAAKQQGDTSVIVPLGGNAWCTDKDTLGGKITNDGIVDWSNPDAEFTAYVRIQKPGKLKLARSFGPIRKQFYPAYGSRY